MGLRVEGQYDVHPDLVPPPEEPPGLPEEEREPTWVSLPPNWDDVPPPDHPPDEAPPPGGLRAAEHGEPLPPVDLVDRHRDTLVDWSTFWDADRRGEDWLVEPLLPRGKSIATFSPAGSGKSLLSVDVCARAATGRKVLDQPVGEPLRVCYFDLEMNEDDLVERLGDMGYGPDDDLGRLFYYLLPNLPPLDTEAGGAEIRAIADHHDADLVVIDTTSRVLAGPENDADTIRDYHRHTGRGLKADGRTVWRLDHAGKDLERGQRGTSAKNDDVDIVWRLTDRDGSAIKLRATKRRLSWVPETLDLVRLEGPLRHERGQDSWPAGTADAAKLLDSLDIPLDQGRQVTRRALKDAGHPMSNVVLAAALRWRREEAEATDRLRPKFQAL